MCDDEECRQYALIEVPSADSIRTLIEQRDGNLVIVGQEFVDSSGGAFRCVGTYVVRADKAPIISFE